MEKTENWPKHFVNNIWLQHKARSSQFLDEEINLIKDEIDKLLIEGYYQGKGREGMKRRNLFLQFSYLIKVMVESD